MVIIKEVKFDSEIRRAIERKIRKMMYSEEFKNYLIGVIIAYERKEWNNISRKQPKASRV
jgi:hypothetical protein